MSKERVEVNKVLNELTKITDSTKNKMKWITISTLLFFALNLVIHLLFDYRDDVYVIIDAVFFMIMITIVLYITNKSVKSKWEIINNNFKNKNHEEV